MLGRRDLSVRIRRSLLRGSSRVWWRYRTSGHSEISQVSKNASKNIRIDSPILCYPRIFQKRPLLLEIDSPSLHVVREYAVKNMTTRNRLTDVGFSIDTLLQETAGRCAGTHSDLSRVHEGLATVRESNMSPEVSSDHDSTRNRESTHRDINRLSIQPISPLSKYPRSSTGFPPDTTSRSCEIRRRQHTARSEKGE